LFQRPRYDNLDIWRGILKLRNLRIGVLAAVTIMPAPAVTLYVTSLENHQILTVNPVTHASAVVFTTPTTYADSLFFELNGDLIYVLVYRLPRRVSIKRMPSTGA